ncbi:MAG: hypothetical protein AAGD05_11285 [Bacteroidota bacterium]
MKTIRSYLLGILCAIYPLFSTLHAQNAIQVESIQNVDNNQQAIGTYGDMIRIQLKPTSLKSLTEIPIFLYLNGKRSTIQAMTQDTSIRSWYFRLEGKAINSTLGEIIHGSKKLRLDLGNKTGSIKSTGTQDNFTLQSPVVKAQFVTDSIDLYQYLRIKIVDPAALNTIESNRNNLAIYVEDILMKKAQVSGFSLADSTLSFKLQAEELTRLFYQPFASVQKLQVSIGTAEKSLIGVAGLLKVKFFHWLSISLGGALILALLAMLLGFGYGSNLLRDPISVDGYKENPYSFARTQLAFWTFIVISSFIFIWSTTKTLAILPNSALILLGISLTVTASARYIDLGKTSNTLKRQKPLRKAIEKQRWKPRLFFNEILSDGSGVSIQRVQNFVFTVFLGIVFIRDVLVTLEMPSYSNELLALMGISAAAYTGMKNVENQQPDGNATNSTPTTEVDQGLEHQYKEPPQPAG